MLRTWHCGTDCVVFYTTQLDIHNSVSPEASGLQHVTTTFKFCCFPSELEHAFVTCWVLAGRQVNWLAGQLTDWQAGQLELGERTFLCSVNQSLNYEICDFFRLGRSVESEIRDFFGLGRSCRSYRSFGDKVLSSKPVFSFLLVRTPVVGGGRF